MSYLASISLIQEIAEASSTSVASDRVNTLISILILVKLLPNVVFMPLGGVLADKYDRRRIQIILDVASSVAVLLYMMAIQYQSIPILYFATFCQESLSGLYIPSNASIVPLLTSSESELEKATTLSGLTWSLMAALGSATGGVLVAAFGVRGCFVIDSMTYLTSASFLAFGVRGTFVATEEHKKQSSLSMALAGDQVPMEDDETMSSPRRRTSSFSIKCPTSAVNATDDLISLEFEADTVSEDGGAPSQTTASKAAAATSQLSMFLDGLRFAFVVSPTVGAYALLKGAAALTFGAVDVLNVAFSERGSEGDSQRTSLKLGILFGCVGVGSILGSTLCDAFATLSRPQRTFHLCLAGYVLVSVGCLGMGLFPDQFALICFSGAIRATGTAVLWICSTLLLQKYTPTSILGRIRSIDFSAALLGEALSALGGGLLMDDLGVSAEGLSFLLAAIAIGLFLFWHVLSITVLKPPTTTAVWR